MYPETRFYTLVLILTFVPDYGLTVAGLAQALGVSRQTINELLRERRALSPEMVDLWAAEQAIGDEVERIRPLRVA